MTTSRSPRTEAGKADHDLAWADGDASPVSHDSAREGCEGCAFIARIEAEAAAPRSPRTEAGKRLLMVAQRARDEHAYINRANLVAILEDLLPKIEAEAAAPRSGEGLREAAERVLAFEEGMRVTQETPAPDSWWESYFRALARLRAALAAAPREASEPLRNAGEVMRNGPSKATSLPDELPFSVAPREASEPPST